MTPTLSVEAGQESAIEEDVRVVATMFDGAEGAWVSTHALVVAVVSARVERLPAASTASTRERVGGPADEAVAV